MKLELDRGQIYLVCLYFSLSFFYLSFVLDEEDPVPLLGYILALIIFIVLSHDRLLHLINSVMREHAGIVEETTPLDASALEALRQLSSQLAHDLRTPLATIRASAEACDDCLPSLLDSRATDPSLRPEHREALKATPVRIMRMVDQANHQLNLLQANLGGAEDAEAPALILEAGEVLRQALDAWPFRPGERDGIAVEAGADFGFRGDPALCRNLLFNLLGAALRGGAARRPDGIRISLERGAGENTIVLRQSGATLVPAAVLEGFFARGDHLGLGLRFCRQAMAVMGGRISGEAGADGGPCIRLVFPALAD